MFNSSIENNIRMLDKLARVNENFDIIKRVIKINKRRSAIYFVDGLLKDDIMEKLMEFFYDINDDEAFKNADSFIESCIPYVEVSKSSDPKDITTALLSGIALMAIDGIDEIILIDNRTYPQRETAQPENDKVLRGSNDAFTEIFIHNCVLVRRRIRDNNLTIKAMQAGEKTKTDIALVYMQDKVDSKLLKSIEERIKSIKSQGITMTQQGFVEALIKRSWINPFPKVKYTERPDSAAANVLKGNIAIVVDNSPSAIIIPTSVFDLMEEADDYYFPPVTGTYLRLSRYVITLFSMLITPLWLLANQHPDSLPQALSFILIDEAQNISLFWQLIIAEVAIDGLRLASVNTPDMLSTTIGIIGGIALSEFAVTSGIFASETILYMAFVTIANYTQPSQELSYSIKFMRIILLILTKVLSHWGFIAGLLFIFILLATNKTLSGKSYLYPLFPFNGKELAKRFIRLNNTQE